MPHGGLLDDVSDPRDLERHNEEVRLLYVGIHEPRNSCICYMQKSAHPGVECSGSVLKSRLF